MAATIESALDEHTLRPEALRQARLLVDHPAATGDAAEDAIACIVLGDVTTGARRGDERTCGD